MDGVTEEPQSPPPQPAAVAPPPPPPPQPNQCFLCGGKVLENAAAMEYHNKDVHKKNNFALTYSHFCKYACSEEVPELQDMGGPAEGGFSIAFDPLDGSSIVDTNFTVGNIFGVWPGDKLTGVTGRDQVAAAMGIFGPWITYVLALKDCPGTHEFLLLDEGLNTNTVN
ncbi:sedoheptulose-1,7-bisphosphatase, chloroplastic-like [Lycium ferocissimum]|uniref:sedoheptulose-1,7-bisphosphatase, chloroplastic-like n=1 Tax=Lycium ferocissimum TaxID=112874 RepID=UPI002816367F|nr:sedoheptulose-1,7-bisphosphatase, chloroplastic-like [Lycium ferocissimum]